MLKPYAYIAGEKVIVDQDGVASVIGLFNKVILNLPPGASVPNNAVAPKDWSVYTAWDIDAGDELRDLMFCLQIFYPDKTQFGEITKIKMNLERDKRAQLKINIQGFPIGQKGAYTVRSWIEENGDLVAGPLEFSISVEINIQERVEPAPMPN